MADLKGYFGAPIASGSTYVWGQIAFVNSINPGIDAFKDNLPFAGWTQPTLTDGDLDGVKASGSLTALSFPCHQPGSDGSGVPDIEDGAFAGTFDGVIFQFFDPLAIPPDPDPTTGGPPQVVGIPLSGCGSGGEGSLGTLGTFCASASANTRWNFSIASSPVPTPIIATVDVEAQHTGTAANVDAYQGSWAPNGAYLGGPGPLGGGWNLYSTPAPNTGDQFKLTIYEDPFEATPTMKFEVPIGSGNFVSFPLDQTIFNVALGPYQLMLQKNQTAAPGMVNLRFVMVSALQVPDEMGSVPYTISGVTNTAGSVPVVVTTSTPHNLTAQDRLRISGATGSLLINGSWWAAKIISPTQFWMSNTPLIFMFGDDSVYTSGGTVFEIGTSLVLNISAVMNSGALPVLITTTVPHGYQIGTRIEVSGAGGIPSLSNTYSVASVPSPTTMQIAAFDAGVLDGDGNDWTGGGTVETGIFNAMVALSQMGAFTDDGQGVTVSAQGVVGNFPTQLRYQINGGSYGAGTQNYTVAINVPFSGLNGTDMSTTAGKALIVAPYVAVRIANGQEARMLGTFWDMYVELQNHDYGEMASTNLPTIGTTNFMAWLNNDQVLAHFNATLWMRTAVLINNDLGGS